MFLRILDSGYMTQSWVGSNANSCVVSFWLGTVKDYTSSAFGNEGMDFMAWLLLVENYKLYPGSFGIRRILRDLAPGSRSTLSQSKDHLQFSWKMSGIESCLWIRYPKVTVMIFPRAYQFEPSKHSGTYDI